MRPDLFIHKKVIVSAQVAFLALMLLIIPRVLPAADGEAHRRHFLAGKYFQIGVQQIR